MLRTERLHAGECESVCLDLPCAFARAVAAVLRWRGIYCALHAHVPHATRWSSGPRDVNAANICHNFRRNCSRPLVKI